MHTDEHGAGQGSAVTVEEREGKGRALVASRDISAGEELLVQTAFASVTLEDCREEICHQCFAPLPKARPLVCEGCEMVRWCTDACRADADRGHVGMECESLRKLDVSLLHDGDAALAKLFVKILCARVRDGQESFQDGIGMLEGDVDKVDGERLSELEMVAGCVLDALPRSAAIDEEELEALLIAEQCNSFGLWRTKPPRQGTLVGFGVFPRLCMLNHACLPNVTVAASQRPPRAVLRAMALVDVKKGEELCISYSEAHLLKDKQARQNWLAKTYLFECSCDLCKCEDAEATALVATFEKRFRCKINGCKGLCFPSGDEGLLCALCGCVQPT